jgi:protein SCO1
VGHRGRSWAGVVLLLAVAGALACGPGQAARRPDVLPQIGAAPDFTLTTQDGAPLSLGELRGKVVALTFIYTSCTDSCSLLTAYMAGLQRPLGQDFGSNVYFLSVTVDPERDTPEALRRYAAGFGADPAGWAFLTGTPALVREVAGRYGVFVREVPGGEVQHTFLTSVIDRRGTLRVQYLGARFDPGDLLRDLRSLLREGERRWPLG